MSEPASGFVRALSALADAGVDFEAGDEPFVDPEDGVILGRIIERGANLTALHGDGSEIDLMTSISGFEYSGLAEDATNFEVAGVSIKVGRLTKLLRSKEVSGRQKDLEFIRIYRATLGEDES